MSKQCSVGETYIKYKVPGYCRKKEKSKNKQINNLKKTITQIKDEIPELDLELAEGLDFKMMIKTVKKVFKDQKKNIKINDLEEDYVNLLENKLIYEKLVPQFIRFINKSMFTKENIKSFRDPGKRYDFLEKQFLDEFTKGHLTKLPPIYKLMILESCLNRLQAGVI